jgi:hypothetical protein
MFKQRRNCYEIHIKTMAWDYWSLLCEQRDLTGSKRFGFIDIRAVYIRDTTRLRLGLHERAFSGHPDSVLSEGYNYKF